MSPRWTANDLARLGVVPLVPRHSRPRKPATGLTLVINDAPPSLNRMIRMHWSVRRELQKVWLEWVWSARRQKYPLWEPLKRAKVRIERQSPKLLDMDNAYGSIKVVLDALKSDGVIVDDSPEHIELTVTQFRGEAQTRIYVEPL